MFFKFLYVFFVLMGLSQVYASESSLPQADSVPVANTFPRNWKSLFCCCGYEKEVEMMASSSSSQTPPQEVASPISLAPSTLKNISFFEEIAGDNLSSCEKIKEKPSLPGQCEEVQIIPAVSKPSFGRQEVPQAGECGNIPPLESEEREELDSLEKQKELRVLLGECYETQADAAVAPSLLVPPSTGRRITPQFSPDHFNLPSLELPKRNEGALINVEPLVKDIDPNATLIELRDEKIAKAKMNPQSPPALRKVLLGLHLERWRRDASNLVR